MSFRNTAITEYLYKYGREKDLDKILEVLNEYGYFRYYHSPGQRYFGYFHGVIKDLDGLETRLNEKEILVDIKKRTGIRLVINYEYIQNKKKKAARRK